jgi:hypothetical protein
MGMFEYVAVLTSIIIGLGITHLLQGVARLIHHPGRERLYWVHLLWVLYMFFTAVFWWWWEFRLGETEVWTFQLYGFVIIYAVLLYLLCAILFPHDMGEYQGYREYFYSRRGWFFGLLALVMLVDVADSWVKGLDHLLSLGIEYQLAAVMRVVLFTVAAVWGGERFHRSLVVVAVIYQVSFAVRLFETVG